MSFLRKLGKFARDFVELFPPEAEREPTIAEDYPEKWKRIKKLQRVGLWFCFLIGIAFLFLAGLRLQELLAVPLFDAQQQAQLRPYAYPFLGIGAFGIAWTGAFACPRCKKPFHGRYRGQTLIANSRCVHCNLKAGSDSTSVRVR